MQNRKPVIGFAGYSGSGKTTLIEKVIPLLKASGVRIALVKHSHHVIDPDKPGKDSFRLRKAGSDQFLMATRERNILFSNTMNKTGKNRRWKSVSHSWITVASI